MQTAWHGRAHTEPGRRQREPRLRGQAPMNESQGYCAGSQAPPPLPGAVIDPRPRHVGTFYSCYKTKRNNGWGGEAPVWSGRPVTRAPFLPPAGLFRVTGHRIGLHGPFCVRTFLLPTEGTNDSHTFLIPLTIPAPGQEYWAG